MHICPFFLPAKKTAKNPPLQDSANRDCGILERKFIKDRAGTKTTQCGKLAYRLYSLRGRRKTVYRFFNELRWGEKRYRPWDWRTWCAGRPRGQRVGLAALGPSPLPCTAAAAGSSCTHRLRRRWAARRGARRGDTHRRQRSRSMRPDRSASAAGCGAHRPTTRSQLSHTRPYRPN